MSVETISKRDLAMRHGIPYQRALSLFKNPTGKKIYEYYCGEATSEIRPKIVNRLKRLIDDHDPRISMQAMKMMLDLMDKQDAKEDSDIIIEFPHMQPPPQKLLVYDTDSEETTEYQPEQYKPYGDEINNNDVEKLIGDFEDNYIVDPDITPYSIDDIDDMTDNGFSNMGKNIGKGKGVYHGSLRGAESYKPDVTKNNGLDVFDQILGDPNGDD